MDINIVPRESSILMAMAHARFTGRCVFRSAGVPVVFHHGTVHWWN